MTIHKFNENKNNVTVIGNPTINGNVVSGFTNSNYCHTPSNIAIGTSNYEVVVCFKITSSPSDYQELISLDFSFAISVISEMKPHHNVGNGTDWLTGITSDTALSLNTKYYLKAVRSSGVSKLYISTDGVSYTEVGSLSNTTNIPTNIYGLGKKINGNGYGQYVTLYLDKCYIKVGSSVVWKGVGAYEKIKDIYCGRAGTEYKRIKKVYKENTLVYQALDDWEIPYRLDGCTWSSSNWNNNNDIPLIFDKNLDTRCGSGGRNGNYNVRTISINLPYYVYIERGRMVNGVPDRNGVGLCSNFQIWTNSGKGTPLTNYESISRSSKAIKDFNSINTTVKTNTLYFEISGDGWTGCTEIYLWGKRVLD